jgi:hypothetical protein
MSSAKSLSRSVEGLIPRLSVVKVGSGHYAYEVSHSGQLLYEEEGFAGITEALQHAIDSEPKFDGFEVAYEGYAVGTYTLVEVASSTEKVSEAAVQTKAKFFRP